jgi:hypothetical protein
MVLKFEGEYTRILDEPFGVQTVGHREYNPLTNIPSVLRELPFKKRVRLQERSLTFIDIELVKNIDILFMIFRTKKTFAHLLNQNVTNDGADRKEILKELSKVYGDDVWRKFVPSRGSTPKEGRFIPQRYEKEYIDRFVRKTFSSLRVTRRRFVPLKTDCNFFLF